MLAPAVVAFAHFLAFFTLVAALVLQLALITSDLEFAVAKRIQRADRAYAISAVLLLVFGFLRVFYFEKGADYYFSNGFFLLKLGLFILVGLISIYPTLTYLRWGAAIKRGEAPSLTAQSARKLKRLIHLQLAAIAVILLCASLMAAGLGILA